MRPTNETQKKNARSNHKTTFNDTNKIDTKAEKHPNQQPTKQE